MGHEIVYCVHCATKIPGVDFERGKAFRVGGKVVCSACISTLSPEEQKEASLSSSRIKAAKAAPSQGSSVRIPLPRAEAPPSSGTPMVLFVGGGLVLALVGVLVLMLSGGSKPVETATPVVPPTRAEKTTHPPAIDVPEDPAHREAQAAIELARARTKSAPDDLDAQVAAWEEAARKAALTPFFKEASLGLQDVNNRRAALKSPVPEVEKPIEKPVVKPPVEAAPKPPSPEQMAFLARWNDAMAKASARDFDGAIADLGRIAAENNDMVFRKRARADIEDLKFARTILAEIQGGLAKLSRGQTVEIAYRGETGEPATARGTVVRAGPARVELRQGDGTITIEAEDVTIASLARLRGGLGAPERRGLAILCLLESDRTGADGLVAYDVLGDRYWNYVDSAAAHPPKPAPRELEARRRFYEAEREFEKADSMASAILKYKSLATDYADTRVVRSEQVRIQKRSDAARDYVFVGGGVKGTGTFVLAPSPRTEFAWTSRADVEGDGAMLGNYVEVEFAALPETAYRAWALVGGCCAENFTFYLQATEATDVNPKTKQKAPIDPGSALASLVKHSISGLKKTHEEHKIKGSKTHPKTASRWEWVSIPLPRYSAPGAKKIRLLSDQQGFAVGAVVVSSTRTGVIPESELKEEAARIRALTVAQQEGLVGWWRLDEGAGATVSDAANVGHTGVVHGVPKWVAGKVGGALKFGRGESVTTDARYALKTLTLSAWVRHDEFSKEQQRYVSLSDETAVIRCSTDRTLHFYIRTNGALQHLYVPNVLELGKWTHIAGTWDGKTQKLYKDGVLLDSKTPGGSLKGEVSVSISAQNEYMHGAIDEVRIYDRALSDAEIRKLAGGSTSTMSEIAAPPPPAGKPWRPLFDGTSLSALRNGQGSWKVDNGALAYIPGTDDAAQTRELVGDEVRIRFEVKDLTKLWFVFRQGAEAQGYRVGLDDNLKALEGKPHELIISAKDDQVVATLDGKPVPISSGNAKSGCLQFNARGQVGRILSIDVR